MPREFKQAQPYVTPLGAWALAFGCSVGWGAFVMPGTTFLPVAGPLGTALGLGLGTLVMLVFSLNYHYLMNRYPGCGGVYTYTKRCFGYDHGFVSAWFLVLTYVAIIWANATALPLIARTLLGGVFQFGLNYEIAGYHVYLGEILLAEAALLLAAALCLRRRPAERVQIVMALSLFALVLVCCVIAVGKGKSAGVSMAPAFSPANSAFGGLLTVFALAPWAFVGFESISHSTEEAAFPLKKSFRILAVSAVTAGIAYILLVLQAVSARPEGFTSWVDYTASLGSLQGAASQPVFYAAGVYLGGFGRAVMGAAALCAIFTGLIGNYIALSRLLKSMSDDNMLGAWVGELDGNCVPRRAILAILTVSLVLPFFGRTAISWIVDVTTVGATIAYAYASAAAWKSARQEHKRGFAVAGLAGFVLALLFAVEFLVPNLTDVKTLSLESYFILAAWAILGMLFFRRVFRRDTERRFGRSVVVWMVLLALIIYASSVWMEQETDRAIDSSVAPIQSYYTDKFLDAGMLETDEPGAAYMLEALESVKHAHAVSSSVQIILIIAALLILFDIYHGIQKREKQIEVEKALAEEASRAKTSFLSSMSHEIRTPMNAIIGLDNIALRNPDLAPETRQQLEKIGSSAKHLLGLINDILDINRIESGRMVLKDEEFSFRELLDQVNIIINGQCQDKGLHYTCHIVGQPADFYYGDDMKLKQVLINILGNAVKFTNAPGSVTLTAEDLGETGERHTLRFTMQDTGIGMDKEYLPRLFEAFSQEDATAVNRYGGSGLGMALTKSFVEMMGGEIQVESEKGVGSTFTVTVALKASDRVAQSEQGTEQTVQRDLADRRILMAEDVAQNAEILSDLLELEDMEAEHAETGEEALRMFRESPVGYYDAILMDMRMPVMDGLTATRAIRALDRADAKTVPIIAMTANVFEEDVQSTREAGMNAHLGKPIEPERLYDTLARLIAERN